MPEQDVAGYSYLNLTCSLCKWLSHSSPELPRGGPTALRGTGHLMVPAVAAGLLTLAAWASGHFCKGISSWWHSIHLLRLLPAAWKVGWHLMPWRQSQIVVVFQSEAKDGVISAQLGPSLLKLSSPFCLSCCLQCSLAGKKFIPGRWQRQSGISAKSTQGLTEWHADSLHSLQPHPLQQG